ncbi:hypothetical protein JOB18_043494 [Solea senegalensis]|uniref:Uncharacterized protein n=1 Tax=Solea senegalensis TaxID=28829 RepID=A0AAV6RFK3_SOLSE|nr:hypothetical protein JOB18_043494 [Solea senegalensis]
MRPPARHAVAESCCGLIPGCHSLRCDPSVSVTLRALQRGRGNRHEGGRCCTHTSLIRSHLMECELQKLVIEKEWTCALLCSNIRKACRLKTGPDLRRVIGAAALASRKRRVALNRGAFVFIVLLSLGM